MTCERIGQGAQGFRLLVIKVIESVKKLAGRSSDIPPIDRLVILHSNKYGC